MPQSKLRPLHLLALSLAALAPACDPEEALEEMVVSSARRPCVGLEPMLCLRYAEDGGELKSHYSGIQGFTHRWGVETRLRYHVEAVEKPDADAPSEHWIADEIVSEAQDPVGTRYDLNFHESAPDSGWFVASGERLRMIDTEVDCAPALCAEVLSRLAASTPFAAEFELTADEAVPLRLVSLQDIP